MTAGDFAPPRRGVQTHPPRLEAVVRSRRTSRLTQGWLLLQQPARGQPHRSLAKSSIPILPVRDPSLAPGGAAQFPRPTPLGGSGNTPQPEFGQVSFRPNSNPPKGPTSFGLFPIHQVVWLKSSPDHPMLNARQPARAHSKKARSGFPFQAVKRDLSTRGTHRAQGGGVAQTCV
jgi:hypothetical protein